MRLLLALIAVLVVSVCAVVGYVLYLAPNPHDDLR
jgi:hypothetical protein